MPYVQQATGESIDEFLNECGGVVELQLVLAKDVPTLAHHATRGDAVAQKMITCLAVVLKSIDEGEAECLHCDTTLRSLAGTSAGCIVLLFGGPTNGIISGAVCPKCAEQPNLLDVCQAGLERRMGSSFRPIHAHAAGHA